MRALVAWIAVPLAGCNAIAGISDLRTGTLGDAGGVGDASPPADAATADDGSAGDGASADDAAGADAAAADDGSTDAEPPPPACTAPQVGLRIAVLSSASGQFNRIVDNALGISVFVGGAAFTSCFLSGTAFQFQADPDLSSAVHDWGSVCAPGRRCAFVLTAPTSIDVHLQ